MTDAANQYGTALYELARDENLLEEILPQLQVLCQVTEGSSVLIGSVRHRLSPNRSMNCSTSFC